MKRDRLTRSLEVIFVLKRIKCLSISELLTLISATNELCQALFKSSYLHKL